MNLKASRVKQLENNECILVQNCLLICQSVLLINYIVNIKGFPNLRDYIICACDGSIFDLPNTPTTKKAFNIPPDTVFKRFLSRGRVSCILDVHSKHILTSKIVSRSVSEVKLEIEHLNNLNKRFDLTKLIVIYDRGYGSTELMLYTIYLNSKFIIRLNSKVFKKKIQQMNSNDEYNTSKY